LTKSKKDLIILSLGKALQVIIALVSIRILTELLSEQEVGNYYLLLTVLTLFNFAFLNPLGQYYGRHLVKWEHSKNLLNATNVLLFLRISAIVFSLFVAFTVYQIFGYEKYYTLNEFLLFIFVSLVAGTHGVLLNAVNTLGDRIKFISYVVLTLVVGLILSLVIVHFIDKSGIGWLYGVAISQIIFSFTLYRYIVKNNNFSLEKVKIAFQKEYVKKIAIFIIPVTITLFLQWGQNQSYRFIIEAKYSLEILAYIGVGLAVSGAIFSAVESLATQFYNPIYIRQITHANKQDRAKAWNDLASYMIPIYLVLAVYVILLAPYITNLLVAEKFYEAYIYAMFGVGIEFFRVITNLVYTVSQSEVKTNTTILPYTIGFIVTMSSLYFFDMSESNWLIPLFVGLSNGLICLLLFISMKKLLDIKVDVLGLIKSFFLASPLLLVLLVENTQELFQTILIIGISGLYFLFLVYIIAQKRILGENR
jgi:O-antigen/teichoic acid export membrane protein